MRNTWTMNHFMEVDHWLNCLIEAFLLKRGPLQSGWLNSTSAMPAKEAGPETEKVPSGI